MARVEAYEAGEEGESRGREVHYEVGKCAGGGYYGVGGWG